MSDTSSPGDLDIVANELTNAATVMIGRLQLLRRRLERGGPLDVDATLVQLATLESAIWTMARSIHHLNGYTLPDRPT